MEKLDQDIQTENQERSNSSSFEDLSNEGKEIPSEVLANKKDEPDQPLDILGNGQLLKKVHQLVVLKDDSQNHKESIRFIDVTSFLIL